MSIKQNGGVFGRNPTFNDVTIEGQLTFDGDIDINSDLKVDGDLDVTGKINTDTYLSVTAGSPNIRLMESDTTDENYRIRGQAGQLIFEKITDAASVVAESFRIDASNDIKISSGNLIIGTSGKGIDFSATAGTGTSELLDDYEEGVWTPGLAGYGPTPTTAQGTYIKVGGMVMAGFKIVLNGADTSQFRIDNLPFVAGSAGGPDYGDGGYITFTDSGVTDIRLISDGADDVIGWDSSGIRVNYSDLGSTAEIKGTIIYSTV